GRGGGHPAGGRPPGDATPDDSPGRDMTAFPSTGIGLRGPHLAAVMAAPPAVGFLEVHPENYMGGGPALGALERLRRDRPISLHGVGLSLGSADGIDEGHPGP